MTLDPQRRDSGRQLLVPDRRELRRTGQQSERAWPHLALLAQRRGEHDHGVTPRP